MTSSTIAVDGTVLSARIPLADHPDVRAWIAYVEALPGFRPMPVTARSEAGN